MEYAKANHPLVLETFQRMNDANTMWALECNIGRMVRIHGTASNFPLSRAASWRPASQVRNRMMFRSSTTVGQVMAELACVVTLAAGLVACVPPATVGGTPSTAVAPSSVWKAPADAARAPVGVIPEAATASGSGAPASRHSPHQAL